MAKFRIRIVVDDEIEAETMDEAINDFCESFNAWDEVDCEEIKE